MTPMVLQINLQGRQLNAESCWESMPNQGWLPASLAAARNHKIRSHQWEARGSDMKYFQVKVATGVHAAMFSAQASWSSMRRLRLQGTAERQPGLLSGRHGLGMQPDHQHCPQD